MKTTILRFGAARNLALVALLGALAATGCASDKTATTTAAPPNSASAGEPSKIATSAASATSTSVGEPSKIALAAGDATSAVLSTLAKTVRSGTSLVGGERSLDSEEGRFHRIHAKAIGMKCAACHASDNYPENFLYLRKAEFPHTVDGEKVKAVNRAMCIGCHSEGSVATPFYNITSK